MRCGCRIGPTYTKQGSAGVLEETIIFCPTHSMARALESEVRRLVTRGSVPQDPAALWAETYTRCRELLDVLDRLAEEGMR